LAGEWLEPFPELARDPPIEAWLEAWLGWCQPRGLPAAEAASCDLETQGIRLRVMVPPGLLGRLQTSHGEALRGKAWLLAGAGRTRAAAQLEIVARP
jgi:hypothetical protein